MIKFLVIVIYRGLLNHLRCLSRELVLVLHGNGCRLRLNVLSLLSQLAVDDLGLFHPVLLLELNLCLEISVPVLASHSCGFVQIAWSVWAWLIVHECIRVGRLSPKPCCSDQL